ncbi:MAG: Acyl-CoA thioesterase I precursor [Betaproteobacteria bacterium ADurb.Bin341]|nr:MAG: Acyl-CoA thioesterase I precursor [Betaproteobacteria bacterium ADurb.Bin341]
MSCVLVPMAGCGKTPQHSALPSGTSVLAFGNSVTYGTGAQSNENYPLKLAARTGWKIHNAGIPGDTADLAKSRIADAIEESKPALVIVEIGGNDFLRQRPEAEVKEDIRAILKSVRQSGAIPVLVAVPRLSMLAVLAKPGDSPIYAELANEEGVLLVEQVFSDILSNNRLKTDPIHPNGAGYQKLADGIAETLVKSGLLAKP